MENIIAIGAAFGATIIISLILKLYNARYLSKEKKSKSEALSHFDLLPKNVSYKKYKKIVRRSSVPNNPIRSNGDFLDFILEADNLSVSNNTFIENNLFSSNCGVLFDE